MSQLSEINLLASSRAFLQIIDVIRIDSIIFYWISWSVLTSWATTWEVLAKHPMRLLQRLQEALGKSLLLWVQSTVDHPGSGVGLAASRSFHDPSCFILLLKPFSKRFNITKKVAQQSGCFWESFYFINFYHHSHTELATLMGGLGKPHEIANPPVVQPATAGWSPVKRLAFPWISAKASFTSWLALGSRIWSSHTWITVFLDQLWWVTYVVYEDSMKILWFITSCNDSLASEEKLLGNTCKHFDSSLLNCHQIISETNVSSRVKFLLNSHDWRGNLIVNVNIVS